MIRTSGRRTLIQSLILALAALWANISAAADNGRVFTAVYQGEYSGFSVKMNRTLDQIAPNRYRLRSETSNILASIEETSHFTVTNGVIKPLDYEYRRKVFGRKTVESLAFDWSAGRVRYRRTGRKAESGTTPLTLGILDPALYQLALQIDATHSETSAKTYEFAKRKKRVKYTLVHERVESIKLDGNMHRALKYTKSPRGNESTDVWLLPNANYTLGKLVHDDGDNQYEVLLSSYSVNNVKWRALLTSIMPTSRP